MPSNKTTIKVFLASCIILIFYCQGFASEHSYTFRISGSGSGLASIRPIITEFNKQNPDINIQVLPSTGTTGGILALMDDAIDLSIAARPLSPEEQKLDIVWQPYGSTVIAFTVHSKAEVTSTSEAEIVDILSGKITHWPDGSYIRLVMRSSRESDFIPVINHNNKLAKALKEGLSRTDVIFSSTAEDNIEILQSLPGSLGLTSLAQLQSEQTTLKPLMYNNIAPTLKNLNNGSYPFHKTFFLVYKKHLLSTALKSFVDFILSNQACNILKANGQACRGA